MSRVLLLAKDIERSFKSVGKLTIVSVGGSFVFSLVVVILAFAYAERQRESVYLLDQGKSLLLTLQTDAIMNKGLEVKDHVKRFHELMFNIAPQRQAIQDNLDRAFNLADKSAYKYSQDLAEKGYYARIVSANISQQMVVDSVVFISDAYPYEVMTYARQYVIRESTMSEYSFRSSCQVIDAGGRSDVNPHGLIVERFQVLENNLIETRKR